MVRLYGLLVLVLTLAGGLLATDLVDELSTLGTQCRQAPIFHCGFETGLCGLLNSGKTHQWKQRCNATSSRKTGPSGPFKGKKYVYVEASKIDPGTVFQLSTNVLKYEGDACVKFAYHMYGDDMGALQVRKQSSISHGMGDLYQLYQLATIWASVGDQGDYWLQAQVSVNLNVTDQITWTGVVGTSHKSDIAIDELNITEGMCPNDCMLGPIDCEWLTWSNWSSCAHAGDQVVRFRDVKQLPSCGGQPCTGKAFEHLKCCIPVNCELSSWGSWGSCQNGQQRRSRTIRTQPVCGGTLCGLTAQTRTCTVLFQCDFEKDTCLAPSSHYESVLWFRDSRGTPSSYTGPKSGNAGSRYYLYLEASNKVSGTLSGMSTPELHHRGPVCVEFYYHMSGNTMGTLQLTHHLQNRTTVWARDGDQGKTWIKTAITVNMTNENETITWVASVGPDYKSDIALDDIRITPEPCPSNPECQPSDCVWDDWSYWAKCKNDKKVRQRSTVHAAECGGEPCSGSSVEVGCCSAQDCVVGSWGEWTLCQNGQRSRNRPISQEASCGGLPCSQTEELANCTDILGCGFETSKCLLQGHWDWRRHDRFTPHQQTGPKSGHKSIWYIFLEGAERVPGENFRLRTPELQHRGPVCVAFYYHMYGVEMGTLQLTRNLKNHNVVWVRAGDQGDRWIKAAITVNMTDENEKITWTATAGTGYRSDIALDDIRIAPEPCPSNPECQPSDCVWDEWASWIEYRKKKKVPTATLR